MGLVLQEEAQRLVSQTPNPITGCDSEFEPSELKLELPKAPSLIGLPHTVDTKTPA